jgi:hypothetical protein
MLPGGCARGEWVCGRELRDGVGHDRLQRARLLDRGRGLADAQKDPAEWRESSLAMSANM